MLHANSWYVYTNEKKRLVKCGYLVEVVGHEKKKVILEVVDDPIIEEPTDHEEIKLRGLITIILTKIRRALL